MTEEKGLVRIRLLGERERILLEGRYVRKIRTSKSEANLGWRRFKQIIDENEASFVVEVDR